MKSYTWKGYKSW